MSMPARVLALVLLLAAAAGASDRKPVRLATLAPSGSSTHQLLLEMGEVWREGPDGGVRLIVNAGGLMGGEADVVRKMRAGQVHAALLTVVGIAQIDSSVTSLQNLPLAFRTLDEVKLVRDRLSPRLEARLEEKGFVVLGWVDVGWVRFFSRQKVLRPTDLRDLRIFTWSGSVGQVDLMKSLRLKPVPLEPSDILTSLQTGLIDCVPAVPYYAQILQYYEPAPHMLDLAWAPLVGGLVISQRVWEGLPEDLRATAKAAAARTCSEITLRNRRESDESVEAMSKRGLSVHAVTPEIEAEWRAYVEPLYPRLRGMDVPADLFDEVFAVLEEHRKSREKPPR